MTREEAKLILQAARPGGQDLADPQVIAAIERAQQDPELAAWWQAERALDAIICSKLEEISIPPGLRARILDADNRPDTARSWRRSAVFRLAASIALIAALSLLWLARSERGHGGNLGAMQADLSGFLKEFPRLDLETRRWPEITEWLASRTTAPNVEIPPAMQKYPGIGCREFQWRDRRVLLVCFAAQGELVHLFIIPPASLPEPTVETRPHFSRVQDWSAATWTRGQVSYLVLTKGNEAFLKGIIPKPQSRG